MLKESTTEEWLAFEWPGLYFYQMAVPAPAWAYGFAKYTKGLSQMVITHEKATSSLYVIRREYEEMGKEFFPKVKKDPASLYRALKETHQAALQIFKLGNKWNFDDFSALSDEELIARHKELFKWDAQLWQEGQVQNIIELHNSNLTEYIREMIAREFAKSDITDVFGVLSTGKYRSRLDKQDEDFVKLVKSCRLLKKNNKDFIKAIDKHWKKYTWMTYGWAGPAIAEKSFLENMLLARKNFQILDEIKKRHKKKKIALKKQRVLYKKLKGAEKKMAILFRDLLDSKAERVDAHSQTYFLAGKMNIEIAKRTNLSLNQVLTIPPFDVPEAFKKPKAEQLNKEWDYMLLWYEGKNSPKKYTGQAARNKFNYVKKRLPKIKAVNELKGELAYPGNVKGRVRLILNIKDAGKFKAGEVLVTRITDPSYVPIMKKAKAIITDIGGITSHAAIMSRELQRPCVVGTRIGTRILKTGDKVAINAEKGIIKKL